MSNATIWCDGCGKASEGPAWMHIAETITYPEAVMAAAKRDPRMNVDPSGVRVLSYDFCSPRCYHQWQGRMAQDAIDHADDDAAAEAYINAQAAR